MDDCWTPESLARASRAEGTWRGYAANWRDFNIWCADHGVPALPAAPETVGAYLADAGRRLKPSTVDRHLSAILVHHRRAGHPLDRHHPAIGDVLNGLRRVVGVRPEGKTALTTADLAAVVATLPDSLAGIRDRALLLLTFCACLRRSESATLQVRDLFFTSEGLVVTVRRSKEDQEGRGLCKGVPFGAHEQTCPVRAARRWKMAARLDDGPLWRPIDRHDRLRPGAISGEAVAAIAKRAVARWAATQGMSTADCDALRSCIAGHSLRSGFCTSAAEAGATALQIQQVSGHRRLSTISRYVRQADLLSPSHIARKLGL